MDQGLSQSSLQHHGDIVTLNIGGRRFTTSRQTLTWVQDSFFSSLLSGRIPSLRDDTGAIFVDRDPDVFVAIVHFLRTREVNLRGLDVKTVRSEAEFYSITPLVKRLLLCEDVEHSSCGGILFVGSLSPSLHLSTLDGPPSALLPPYKLFSDVNKNVRQITCHGNCLAVAFAQVIIVYALGREGRGWEQVYTSPPLDRVPQHIALRTKVGGGSHLGDKLLAAVLGTEVRVWTCSPTQRELTSLEAKFQVDHLFFIGCQLVVLGSAGKVAVWQAITRHWQVQAVAPICSFDSAGSFLLLGCSNGSIYHIDMEKFPLRMKDNDLLVSQLFQDPNKEAITALSVYLTPAVYNGGLNHQWIEIAYGTSNGTVKVIVQHPENVGKGPQVFDTFTVHTCPLAKVVLGEKHLVSVCADNHVRTWNVTRFRGCISTQPGSSSLASFRVLSLDGTNPILYPDVSIGPYGEVGEEQVFIQRVVPETRKLFVRLCSSGSRICEINSVDGSSVSSVYVHEFEGANRLGSRARRYIITGHSNGSIQLWDLTTAIEISSKAATPPATPTLSADGGPSREELLDMLHAFDISASRCSSSVNSRAPSPSPSLINMLYPGHRANTPATPIFPRLGLRGSGRQITPLPLPLVTEGPLPLGQDLPPPGPAPRPARLKEPDTSRSSETDLPQPMLDTPSLPHLLIDAKQHAQSHVEPKQQHAQSHVEPKQQHAQSHVEPKQQYAQSHVEPKQQYAQSHVEPKYFLPLHMDTPQFAGTEQSCTPAQAATTTSSTEVFGLSMGCTELLNQAPFLTRVSSTSSLHSALTPQTPTPGPAHSRTFSTPHKSRFFRVHSQTTDSTSNEHDVIPAGESPSQPCLFPQVQPFGSATMVTRMEVKKLMNSDLPSSDC